MFAYVIDVVGWSVQKSRWAFLDTHLTALQNRLQGIVALTSKLGVTAPVGASNGLAGVLQGGGFLVTNPDKTDLQKSARELAEITAVSEFFRSIVSLGLPFSLSEQK